MGGNSKQVCRSVPNAAKGLLRFALTLEGYETFSGEASKLIDQIVQTKEFREALDKQAQEYSERYLTNQVATSPPDAKDPHANRYSPTQKNPPVKGVKFSELPAVKSLADGVKSLALEYAENCTAAGVWYNENKTVITVVVAVAAIGAGITVWELRSDKVSSLAEDKGLEKSFDVGVVGKVTVEGKLVKFRPSKQELEAKTSVTLTTRWSKVFSTDLQLRGAYSSVPGLDRSVNWTTGGTLSLRMRATDALSFGSGVSAEFDRYGLGAGSAFVNLRLEGKHIWAGVELRQRVETRPFFLQDTSVGFQMGIRHDLGK